MENIISRGLNKCAELANDLIDLENCLMKFTNSEKYKENILLKETFEFSILVVKYSELLESNKKFAIARQLIRSGTSLVLIQKKLKTQKVKLILYIN